MVVPVFRAGYPRVTHPFAALLTPEGAFSLDLHVLSTPPAFVLSQDQTLHERVASRITWDMTQFPKEIGIVYPDFQTRECQSFLSLIYEWFEVCPVTRIIMSPLFILCEATLSRRV